jgi:hypothetical protein
MDGMSVSIEMDGMSVSIEMDGMSVSIVCPFQSRKGGWRFEREREASGGPASKHPEGV